MCFVVLSLIATLLDIDYVNLAPSGSECHCICMCADMGNGSDDIDLPVAEPDEVAVAVLVFQMLCVPHGSGYFVP